MQVIDCGGNGRCGWKCLEAATNGFDVEAYLGVIIQDSVLSDRILNIGLRRLYDSDKIIRHYLQEMPEARYIFANELRIRTPRNIRMRIGDLLINHNSRVQLNDAWIYLLVMSPLFVSGKIDICIVESTYKFWHYPVTNRIHRIYLFGGTGHWQLLLLNGKP